MSYIEADTKSGRKDNQALRTVVDLKMLLGISGTLKFEEADRLVPAVNPSTGLQDCGNDVSPRP